jgi:small subunit ribosomal protein S20
MVRTYIKKVDAALESGDATAAQEAYNTSIPVIDRMADKGIIHKNKAARHKSRLNTKVKALAAK